MNDVHSWRAWWASGAAGETEGTPEPLAAPHGLNLAFAPQVRLTRKLGLGDVTSHWHSAIWFSPHWLTALIASNTERV